MATFAQRTSATVQPAPFLDRHIPKYDVLIFSCESIAVWEKQKKNMKNLLKEILQTLIQRDSRNPREN